MVLKLLSNLTIEEVEPEFKIRKLRRFSNIPCEGYRDYWGEFDCGYSSELECENCVCSGLPGAWMNPMMTTEENENYIRKCARRFKRMGIRFKKRAILSA